MRPSSGVSSPARSRSSVVLPQPEGPSSTRHSPAATSRSTPRTTSVEPKRLRTLSKRTEDGLAMERSNIYSLAPMNTRARLRAVLAALALAPSSSAGDLVRPDLPLWDQPFTLEAPAEVVLLLEASCPGCSWERKGHEAALLRLEVDGRYAQHVALTRGARPAEYRLALGGFASGTHRLRIAVDRARTPRRVGGAAVTRVTLRPVATTSPEYRALSQTPYVYARPGSVEAASDL